MSEASSPAADRARFGIGALSRAVGIPSETLRTWERRYGFPVPERTPSGHRRYRATDVPRLRRVAALLARGVRAGEALRATDEEAEAMLKSSGTPQPLSWSDVPTSAPSTETLLEAVRRFDTPGLTRLLQAAWARLGPLEFAAGCIPPLLVQVGGEWATGELDVRHEHFLTERVSDLLRTFRLPLEEEAEGPTMVLASLPGEAHGLGLELAALVLVASGVRTIYAGTDLPEAEVAALAVDTGAFAVGISISSHNAGPAASRQLGTLRKRLPRRTKLVVGGEGAPRPRQGVEIIPELRDLGTWARRLAGRAA